MALLDHQQPARVCDHCDAPASLYSLTRGRREGDGSMLAVCQFCYLRLSGFKPHRGQLIKHALSKR